MSKDTDIEFVPNIKGKLVNKKRQDAAFIAKQKRLDKNPNYYAELASKGGVASTHRPMKDPEYARRAVNARWAKYRANKADSEKT